MGELLKVAEQRIAALESQLKAATERAEKAERAFAELRDEVNPRIDRLEANTRLSAGIQERLRSDLAARDARLAEEVIHAAEFHAKIEALDEACEQTMKEINAPLRFRLVWIQYDKSIHDAMIIELLTEEMCRE